MKNEKHFAVDVCFGPLRSRRVLCVLAASSDEAEGLALAEAKRLGLKRPSVLCDPRESLDCERGRA